MVRVTVWRRKKQSDEDALNSFKIEVVKHVFAEPKLFGIWREGSLELFWRLMGSNWQHRGVAEEVMDFISSGPNLNNQSCLFCYALLIN